MNQFVHVATADIFDGTRNILDMTKVFEASNLAAVGQPHRAKPSGLITRDMRRALEGLFAPSLAPLALVPYTPALQTPTHQPSILPTVSIARATTVPTPSLPMTRPRRPRPRTRPPVQVEFPGTRETTRPVATLAPLTLRKADIAVQSEPGPTAIELPPQLDIPFGMPRMIPARMLKAMLTGRSVSRMMRAVGNDWQLVSDDELIDLTEPVEYRIGQISILS